jgi:predicted nucleotidyltransferase
MDLNRPLNLVTPTLDADVLSVLAGANTSFTGRQVHQIMGRHSEKSARTSLQRLCEQGIALKEQKGSAGLYSLNREHLAAPYILGLANVKHELFERMTKAITGWEVKPVFAAIFGSAARGDMRLDSDIDIFLVRPEKVDADNPTWMALHAELSDSVTKWTGNDARVFELSESQVVQSLAAKEKVTTDIREQGIRLVGESSFLQITGQIKKRGGRRGK